MNDYFCILFNSTMKHLYLITLISLCLACSQQGSENTTETASEEPAIDMTNVPAELASAWDAHGSVNAWKKFGKLEYDIEFKLGNHGGIEHHTIDLNSRKVMIDGQDYSIGFDGSEVWAMPAVDSIDISPRFYHNLFFYFFTIPMVLSDPGINYETLEPLVTDSAEFKRVRISYNAGVGDSPEDYYICHFNAESNQMDWLLYTVTYFRGEAHENFNGLIYEDFRDVNGIKLPHSLTGRRYAADTLGAVRYFAKFSNVSLSESSPADDMFDMPEGAEIDSLVQND